MKLLIDKFHQMELESDLFDIGSEQYLPLWDLVRYEVYMRYNYPKKERDKLFVPIKRSKKELFHLLWHLISFLFKLLTRKKDNLVFTASRYVNDQGEYFDKSAVPILKTLEGNALVVEPITGKKTAYKYIYDFSILLTRFYPKKHVPKIYFDRMGKVLNKYMGENLYTYDELNAAYNAYRSRCSFYQFVLFIAKPKNIITCVGNPKALIFAARKYGIKTYLMQHAGIEKDEIDYSYSPNIGPNSPILFPDTVLTYGSYWGRNMNIPAKEIIPVGNDFFYTKPEIPCNDTILIVSTIIHGGELKIFTKSFADRCSELKFIYKLHPNEFHLENDYRKYFQNNTNVTVITFQQETNKLIAQAQLVILIVSAVLYEALNQNKKVVVYKKINYERQLIFSKLPNVFFVDNESEIDEILQKKAKVQELDFYQKSNYPLIQRIFIN